MTSHRPHLPFLSHALATLTLAAGALSITVSLGAGRAQAAPKSGDWPRWRGPNNDGLSTESNWSTAWPKEGPKILWKIDVGKGFSSVSVAEGRLYTMGNAEKQDTVWCLDAETGKEIWTHKYDCGEGGDGHPGPRVTPTVDGDIVYTLSREGHLFALDAKDGKVVWSKNVVADFGVRPSKHGWGIACSPLVLGEKLILDLGKTMALKKKTGDLIWTSGDDEAGFSSPTLIKVGGKTYVNSFNAFGLVLVDAESGKELARVRWETSYDVNAASPIPSGDKVFISSGYGRGCGLFQVGGSALKPIYEKKEMRNHCNSCVLYKGHLYGIDGQMGDRRGKLKCLDFATGEKRWEAEGTPPGGMMIADGKIIAMIDKGDLLVAEAKPDGFKQLARAKVLDGQCWTYPVLAGGRIYCRSNAQGQLACVDVRGK